MDNGLDRVDEEREAKLLFAQSFLEQTYLDIRDFTRSFFKIGFRLSEARFLRYYEVLGYPDIESLAEDKFGFKRSTTYGFIKVYERTCIYGTDRMDEKFIGYDYSKLLELSKPVYGCDQIFSKIRPSDSVREIRAYIRYWNDYWLRYSVPPELSLRDWVAQQKMLPVVEEVQTSGPEEAEQLPVVEEVQTSGPEEAEQLPVVEEVQTSGLQFPEPMSAVGYGLFRDQSAFELFKKRFYRKMKDDYLFYYCPDSPKTPYMGTSLTIDEFFVDLACCFDIFLDSEDE